MAWLKFYEYWYILVCDEDVTIIFILLYTHTNSLFVVTCFGMMVCSLHVIVRISSDADTVDATNPGIVVCCVQREASHFYLPKGHVSYGNNGSDLLKIISWFFLYLYITTALLVHVQNDNFIDARCAVWKKEQGTKKGKKVVCSQHREIFLSIMHPTVKYNTHNTCTNGRRRKV